MTSAEELFQRLERLGIRTTTRRHPPVFTVDQSRALRGALPGAHCKNLLLKDKKGRLWLAVTHEDRPLNLRALENTIGSARLSFARPEVLLEVLGVEPGSVTPFGIVNDRDRRVTVVLDQRLLEPDILNFHPLINDASTQISPRDMLRFLDAEQHTPLIIEFPS
jgi:Ala-tRNA(Pro) deacylase